MCIRTLYAHRRWLNTKCYNQFSTRQVHWTQTVVGRYDLTTHVILGNAIARNIFKVILHSRITITQSHHHQLHDRTQWFLSSNGGRPIHVVFNDNKIIVSCVWVHSETSNRLGSPFVAFSRFGSYCCGCKYLYIVLLFYIIQFLCNGIYSSIYIVFIW